MVTVVIFTLSKEVSTVESLIPRLSIAPDILLEPVPPRETGTIVAIYTSQKKFLYIDMIQELI
jgi:hypothetical protein